MPLKEYGTNNSTNTIFFQVKPELKAFLIQKFTNKKNSVKSEQVN